MNFELTEAFNSALSSRMFTLKIWDTCSVADLRGPTSPGHLLANIINNTYYNYLYFVFRLKIYFSHIS